MKLRMLENYQGVGDSAVLLDEGITVTILEAGERYEVSENLGAWLVENGKAQVIPSEKKVVVGEQPEPEPVIEKPRRKRGAA